MELRRNFSGTADVFPPRLKLQLEIATLDRCCARGGAEVICLAYFMFFPQSLGISVPVLVFSVLT